MRHRLVQIGVGENEIGALAAQLEAHPLQPVGRLAGDDPAGLGGAGEGDLVDAGMGHQSVPDLLAVAGEHLDDAGRDAGLEAELPEDECGQGGLLGRLRITLLPQTNAGATL